MTEPMLVDTGPLVALVSPFDQYHRVSVDYVYRLSNQLYTCWPVITEAAWLTRHRHDVMTRLQRLMVSRAIVILDIDRDALTEVSSIMHQYRDLKAQFTDAVLLHLAHRENIDAVLTFDRRDFSVYRLPDGRPLRLFPEPI